MIGKPFNSLAGKLIAAVGGLMILGSIVFGYIFIRFEENMMTANLINNASATADLVKRGLYYGMLTAHRETIEQTVEVIGSGPGIQGISIFDKKGRTVYSSRKRDVGRVVGKEDVICQICHRGNEKPLEAIPEIGNWRILSDNSGVKSLILVIPLYNEPSCYTGACHHHPKSQKILGVLQTNLSTAAVDGAIRQNRIGTIVFGSFFIVMISFSLFTILYKLVSRPISLLDEGMRRIAKGDLGYVIEINSSDEMGRLAQTFNSMNRDLKQYKEHMENWTRALEEEVQKKTAETVRAHDQLINAEKLASLGRMAAGVAHELNSPLTGIVTFSHLMLKRTPPANTQDIEDLQVIIEQAERCSKIIKSLLGFSRKTTSEKVFVNINALLESTVALVRNQVKFHNIKFNLDLGNAIPPVSTDPNQIQQVLLNLFINAADAMDKRGQITVATKVIVESVNARKFMEIEVTDTGPGIPEEQLSRIFEPFFTTKPVGKGTGLGLAVSYGIIKKHGGNIFVRSEQGTGASFFVRLPLEGDGEIG